MKVSGPPIEKVRGPFRPFSVIGTDFIKLGVKFRPVIDFRALNTLSRYPHAQYRDLLALVGEAKKVFYFNRVRPAEAISIADLDLSRVTAEKKFLMRLSCESILDLRGLKTKWNNYLKEQDLERALLIGQKIRSADPKPHSQRTGPSVPAPLPIIFKPEARKVLTEKGLLNPKALNLDHPYPANPNEFELLTRHITDPEGKFQGGRAILSVEEFARELSRMRGARVYNLQKPDNLTAVFFDPEIHALPYFDWLIFAADLVSQKATYDAFEGKKIGCSYDWQTYYVDRVFRADWAGFAFYGNMPISFATASSFETTFNGVPLVYAFLHFTMTLRDFGNKGIGSYLASDLLTSIYLRTLLWNRGKNLIIGEDGKVRKQLPYMWVCAHTGRIAAGQTIISSFDVDSPIIARSQAVVETIVGDADRRINGEGRQGGLQKVTPFAWRDKGIYPPENRYLVDDKIFVPEWEKGLRLYPMILDILGGEQGLANGNGAFYCGLMTPAAVLARWKKNKAKIKAGGSIGQLLEWGRGALLSKLTW